VLVKILLAVIAGLVLIILFGCTEPITESVPDLQSALDTAENSLASANLKIIELQESAEYLRKQSDLVKDKKEDLQETYNKIALDWQNCSMANYCLYYPDGCVEYVGTNFDVYGYSAQELHIEYSDLCDDADYHLDEYWEAYTGDK